MFNFKGAIFDLDGTIIDSMGIWEKIDIKFFEEINIPMPSDYIKIINNMSFEESAIYTIKRFNLKESKENLIERWNQMAMFEYAHNIKLKPNVRTYLEKLKENKFKLHKKNEEQKEQATNDEFGMYSFLRKKAECV